MGADGLVARAGKGNHRRDKLRFEGILVRDGARPFVGVSEK